MPTTISIPEDLADELYERKGRGESYADVIWRLIEAAESDESGPQSDESSTGATPEASPSSTSPRTRSDETAETEPATFEDLVESVAEETLPGSGAKLDDRREAFRAVVDYLREHGTATPAELREQVYPAHPGWYEDGKDPARSWWKNAMYPALAELAERSDALARADQTGEWRWVGESGDQDAGDDDADGIYDPTTEFE